LDNNDITSDVVSLCPIRLVAKKALKDFNENSNYNSFKKNIGEVGGVIFESESNNEFYSINFEIDYPALRLNMKSKGVYLSYAVNGYFDSAHQKFAFGKYKHHTLKKICEINSSYLYWCIQNVPYFIISWYALQDLYLNLRGKGIRPDIYLLRRNRDKATQWYNSQYSDPDSDYWERFEKANNGDIESLNRQVFREWQDDGWNED